MVGDDYHHRAVPQPGAAQSRDQLGEQPIDEAELQQMPLQGLVGEECVVVGGRSVESQPATAW